MSDRDKPETNPPGADGRFADLDQLQQEVARRIKDNQRFLQRFLEDDFEDEEETGEGEADEEFEEL